MIEIEKKFAASEEDIKRITEGAEFIKESVNRDTYYDREGFPLVKNNMYLRERNGSFELKVFAAEKGSSVSKYLELEEEKDIKTKLGIPDDKTIHEYLKENEYVPFGSWDTTRKRFKKEGFTVDVDSVDFGHNVLEIELLVEEGGDTNEAADRILDFAKRSGLGEGSTEGKVLEFIKRTNPTACNDIKTAWEKL